MYFAVVYNKKPCLRPVLPSELHFQEAVRTAFLSVHSRCNKLFASDNYTLQVGADLLRVPKNSHHCRVSTLKICTHRRDP